MSCNYVLRKTKSFNKSRYSRNRQYYRTGVFLCLWANIIFLLGGYYVFFRLTFKFSYLFIILLSSFMLVLFSYFSRNFSIGIVSSIIRLINYLTFNTLLVANLLILKIKLILEPYSIVVLRDVILLAYGKLRPRKAK